MPLSRLSVRSPLCPVCPSHLLLQGYLSVFLCVLAGRQLAIPGWPSHFVCARTVGILLKSKTKKMAAIRGEETLTRAVRLGQRERKREREGEEIEIFNNCLANNCIV